jgi:hypothetical protein
MRLRCATPRLSVVYPLLVLGLLTAIVLAVTRSPPPSALQTTTPTPRTSTSTPVSRSSVLALGLDQDVVDAVH